MKGRRKPRDRSPGRPVGGPGRKASREVVPPLTEGPAASAARLEADASCLSTGPRPSPGRSPAREDDIRRREEGARHDFKSAFRRRPQGLVEMVSAMRQNGGADLLRDLLFAAQTLYGDHLRELPGGI